MADFGRALAKTLEHEGVVSDDPEDPGGFYVYGIAENRNQYDPLAKAVLDRARDLVDSYAIEADDEIDILVWKFYRRRFWDRMSLGGMESQELAESVFDFAVVSGCWRSIIMLQEAVNALNRNGKSWDDIAEDGRLGPQTLYAVNAALREDQRSGHDDLRMSLGLVRGRFFLDLMSRRPRLERFARGWFRYRTGLRVDEA